LARLDYFKHGEDFGGTTWQGVAEAAAAVQPYKDESGVELPERDGMLRDYLAQHAGISPATT
jgi:hypothetical protein